MQGDVLFRIKGMQKESHSCKGQLFISKTIIANCQSTEKNLRDRLTPKKLVIIHEWTLKFLNILKESQVLITFLISNIERRHTYPWKRNARN